MSQTLTTFVLFQCGCGCGAVTKIDISKYTKKVQRGLKNDYGFRPLPVVDSHIEPHKCPVCNKKCKADNGQGTQAALEIERFGEVHQYIMRALAAHDNANLDEIRLNLDVMFDYKTTAITLHSRISDLVAWRIVEAVKLDVPTKPTGSRYEAGPAVAYRLDRHRAEIVEKDDWQTFRLKLIDGGASFQLGSFA